MQKKLQQAERIARGCSLKGGKPFIKDEEKFSPMMISGVQFKSALSNDRLGYMYLWKAGEGGNSPFKLDEIMTFEKFKRGYELLLEVKNNHIKSQREDVSNDEEW